LPLVSDCPVTEVFPFFTLVFTSFISDDLLLVLPMLRSHTADLLVPCLLVPCLLVPVSSYKTSSFKIRTPFTLKTNF
jgi:hypothetical protein